MEINANTCGYCGCYMIAIEGQFCSNKCRDKARQASKTVLKSCKHCGKIFEALRQKTKYCTKQCRQNELSEQAELDDEQIRQRVELFKYKRENEEKCFNQIYHPNLHPDVEINHRTIRFYNP